MSLEASLFTLLGALVDGRCTPDKTDDNPVYPLIVYQAVGGVALDFAEQRAAPDDNARVQIVVWSLSRLEASDLARRARDALLGSHLPVKTMGAGVSISNDLLDLYGSRQDFSIWYPRA